MICRFGDPCVSSYREPREHKFPEAAGPGESWACPERVVSRVNSQTFYSFPLLFLCSFSSGIGPRNKHFFCVVNLLLVLFFCSYFSFIAVSSQNYFYLFLSSLMSFCDSRVASVGQTPSRCSGGGWPTCCSAEA